MATAGIQFKIMPEGVETDLEQLKTTIKNLHILGMEKYQQFQ